MFSQNLSFGLMLQSAMELQSKYKNRLLPDFPHATQKVKVTPLTSQPSSRTRNWQRYSCSRLSSSSSKTQSRRSASQPYTTTKHTMSLRSRWPSTRRSRISWPRQPTMRRSSDSDSKSKRRYFLLLMIFTVRTWLSPLYRGKCRSMCRTKAAITSWSSSQRGWRSWNSKCRVFKLTTRLCRLFWLRRRFRTRTLPSRYSPQMANSLTLTVACSRKSPRPLTCLFRE